MLEEIFDLSSFEDNMESSKQVACKIYYMIFSKLLVDEVLKTVAKNPLFTSN